MIVINRRLHVSPSQLICGRSGPCKYGPGNPVRRWFSLPITRGDKPFRMAVIGSGPAGFYTAYQVMSKIENAIVDMYESVPVPFGLVRFGVAPDHPEIKNCEKKFSDVASSPKFNFLGNIDVGNRLPLTSLMRHYNSILFSYGASKDKKLGIPGENIHGVYSARDFVGWYNGLPTDVGLVPNLEEYDEAVIIGQGNVALDVARTLLTDVDQLKKTDMAARALDTLSKSRVRRVRIVGRRGPLQAAFTVKEVRELMNLDGISYPKIDPKLLPSGSTKSLPRTQRRMVELLLKESSVRDGPKSYSLDFLLSPMQFECSSDVLSSILFKRNMIHAANVFDPSAQASSTDELLSMPTKLAFRSIGYKSEALPGMDDIGIRFDEVRGLIPNDQNGRVINPLAYDTTSSYLPGLYCSGWVKCGPTGVIANTMEDAFATAEVIASDWYGNRPFLPGYDGWDGLKGEADARGLQSVSWTDWLKIDAAERERGKARGKDREKFTTVSQLLSVLD